jgi:lipopolysaccharide/colanic/teichoic acid biosynthesis glycosyltransferase
MTVASSRRSPVTTPPPDDAPLVERYAHMAHTFERQPVDLALRALDVVIAGLLLLVTSPLLGAAALAVRVTGRPVLYRGQRVGRAGAVFTMYKLRTLRADSETRLGPYLGAELTQLTLDEQTRVGRLLRASKVDELPQLFNVVRGDMSLVGPRPIRPAFFEQLCEEIPAYWQRLVVRPGLTGLAQLRMSRDMSWAEKLAHDVEFIADRSVRLYLAVIVETAARVFSGHWGG